jgi:hypothetical protein
MSSPVPIAGVVGLVSSAMAVGLWITEQLTGQLVFETLTIPFKLVVVAAPLFLLPALSAHLHGRPRVAIGLGLALIVVTLGAMLAYLPWRTAFAEQFNNAVYRWYFIGMPNEENDFSDWQTAWNLRIPHAIEAALAITYHLMVIALCTCRRLSKLTGALTAAAGYLLLFLVPLLSGLIQWDYDTFLRGIVFDSISMDLCPLLLWHAGDHSLFLYVFMLIFFGVTAVSFCLNRPNAGQEIGKLEGA